MKRETREWLRRLRAEDMDKTDHPATDVLDSDARLRRKVRELKAALAPLCAERSLWYPATPIDRERGRAALAPKRKVNK